MRAAALAIVVALAGCGSPSGAAGAQSPPTGLVLSLRFDHTGVDVVSLSGATSISARRFGPYVVAERALPRDSTVGFVFDAADAGTAMVCAESHDLAGNVVQRGCDTFDIIATEVTKGSLTLDDPFPTH